MDVIYILCLLFSSRSIAVAQGGTCKACNCQFTNIEVLGRLIDTKLAADRPVFGVTYTRWGKTTCPSSTGAQLVYSGRVGGTKFSSQGGSAEKICLPDNPDYIPETSGVTIPYNSTVQSAEYEFFAGPLSALAENNAPCAVCFVPSRAAAIMVPAKTVCPSSWTREYYGYLSTDAELDTHHRSTYNCLDINSESVAGTSDNANPSLFHYTVTNCNGFSCPPFENGRILSCVVCTK